MRPRVIRESVGNLPYMDIAQGRFMYQLITKNKLRMGLELGFYHGVSTAYLAGAFQDATAGGSLVTVDKVSALERQPNIIELLDKLNLSHLVTVYAEPASYTWRLLRLLEEGMRGKFDFCYIDGGHTWDTTGFALSLVTLLLRPGGFVVLDDLDWTIEKSPVLRSQPEYKALSKEERETAGVRKVFELLIKGDNRYRGAYEWRNWGIAQRA